MASLRTRVTLPALALAACLGTPAMAQDLGREGRLSYGLGFDYDFDDGLEVTSDVAVTLVTRTRSQTLEFQLGTELVGDFTDDGADDFDFRDSTARVTYERQGANSSLRFSASYTDTNLRDTVVDSVITDAGTQSTSEFTTRYETGQEGPFGLTLSASYRDRTFVDADPDLTDDVLVTADALARFELSRVTSLRLRAGLSHEDERDVAGTDRETHYLGIGLSSTTASGLSFTGDLLFDETETTTVIPASRTSESGVGVELEVTQDRPNGFFSASLTSRVDEAGRRTRADVTRGFDTKTGAVELSLGVVDQEGADDAQIVGSLKYTVETPRSVFTADLSRDASTDDGDTSVDTALTLAYRREINALSGWEAELGYVATEELGGPDDNRTTASFAYTRNLNQDWSLRTGYAYSKDDDGDAENSVFFNIQRDIAFGF